MAITINAIIIAITDKPSIVKWRSPLWVRFGLRSGARESDTVPCVSVSCAPLL